MSRSPFDEQDAAAGSDWRRLPELDDLAPGATTVVDVGATRLLVCRLGAELLAFRDHCARCGQSLRGAVLSPREGGAAGEAVLRCLACQSLFDVVRVGTSLDDAGSHLTPVPLLVEGGIPSAWA